MEPPPSALSELPEGFEHLSVKEALRVLLDSVLRDRSAYFELRAKHSALVEWIESD